MTSRDLLRIQGEREYAVPPLAEPEAVELFADAPASSQPPTIADLCSRLDHLPLAVELAAARTSLLVAGTDPRPAGAAPRLPHGRTRHRPAPADLRATIAWSHDLLDNDERSLFARLAVFRGGCTLDAATEVADATVDVLQSLVDKSLLRRTERPLLAARDYPRIRARTACTRPTTKRISRRRHAGYYLDYAEEIDRVCHAEGSIVEPFARIAAEHDNLRSALEWAHDN